MILSPSGLTMHQVIMGVFGFSLLLNSTPGVGGAAPNAWAPRSWKHGVKRAAVQFCGAANSQISDLQYHGVDKIYKGTATAKWETVQSGHTTRSFLFPPPATSESRSGAVCRTVFFQGYFLRGAVFREQEPESRILRSQTISEQALCREL